MGFMDKAKKLAEQAQEKLDEAQKNFNQSDSRQQGPGRRREVRRARAPDPGRATPAAAPPRRRRPQRRRAAPAAPTEEQPAAEAPPPPPPPDAATPTPRPDPFKPIQ